MRTSILDHGRGATDPHCLPDAEPYLEGTTDRAHPLLLLQPRPVLVRVEGVSPFTVKILFSVNNCTIYRKNEKGKDSLENVQFKNKDKC